MVVSVACLMQHGKSEFGKKVGRSVGRSVRRCAHKNTAKLGMRAVTKMDAVPMGRSRVSFGTRKCITAVTGNGMIHDERPLRFLL